LFVIFILSGTAFSYSQPTDIYDFQNSCYLTFNQPQNFSNIPNRGVISDNSLVGYWDLNEGSGMLARDSSGNENNGSLMNSTTWIHGIYQDALDFNQTYIKINNSRSLNISKAFTISSWINPNSINKFGQLMAKCGADVYSGVISARVESNNALTIRLSQNGTIVGVTTKPQINSVNTWYNVVFTYDGMSNIGIFVNGTSVPYSGSKILGPIDTSIKPLLFGQREKGDASFDGIIDDIRIYNRSLSAPEVVALYLEPDPSSLANYYTYKDPNTSNTLTIGINSVNAGSDNAKLVTCTNFFTGNKLLFQANGSIAINLWTNLGKPVFTNGTWINCNNTITLSLDCYSIGEVNWNFVPPFASNISTTTTNSGNITTFSLSWQDERSLFGGGYIFSTNNTGQWVNSTWAGFLSNPDWGNSSLTLNNTIGITIGFREFANNSLNTWGDSGINTIETTTIYLPFATPATTQTVTPTMIPTSSVPPTTKANPTPVPTSTIKPTVQPSTIATTYPDGSNQKENDVFSRTLLYLAAISVVVLIAVLALSFRKGYLAIEVPDEESVQLSSEDDYVI
jgi:hypothetical protein